jgi:hypothetical protein
MLDTRPARKDLTTRECAKLLGGTIGGLLEMADLETVRAAVKWWAEQEAVWNVMAMVPTAVDNFKKSIAENS